MARTILIVDDVKINREILKNMLCDDYSIIEAEHGREALAVMTGDFPHLSAVLLDLCMPVMDGYELLSYMRGDEALSQIPVIVTTGQTNADSEEKALELGAKDYVTKPYNAAIIKQRIWNIISLRESAAMVNILQRDALTGLYCRDAFFKLVETMVSVHEPGYYIMACFDVYKFKVINDQYGTNKGDEVLKYIADVFRKGFEPMGGICCRISADNFAILYPSQYQDAEELAQLRRKAGSVAGLAAPVSFSIGRYVVCDTNISPSAMYDRAVLAADSIKGRYDDRVAVYSESMRQELLQEQEIVTEMETALQDGQFEIWYQPQYNHSTGALIGAEALARWRHPQKGMISPSQFVPVFEKNGFIYALDKYMWESACRFLRGELDNNRSPLPVSVNISRYDVFRPDFVGCLTDLVKRYDIPVELLRLEVTESAFAESTQHIVAVIKELISFGFTLEIDDFGSGYSSLNTLKSVPAQVVKLDMGFFDDEDDTERSGSIIESVVRMTKWLGMSVIAEGVETKEQADFLCSIGCSYIQGYLYASPMAEEKYRQLSRQTKKEEKLLVMETVENLDNNSFWNPKSMDTLIFNSYVGGACIYEYHKGSIELLRATEKYAQIIGSAGMTIEDALKLNWEEHLDEENSKRVVADLEKSVKTRKEVTGEYVFLDLPGCPHETHLLSTMRVIASAGDRYLVYCTNDNITEQRKAEKRERDIAQQLKAMMDDIPGGFCRIHILPDGAMVPVYVNDGLCRMTGMSHDEFMGVYANDALAGVHPDDVSVVKEAVVQMLANGEAHSSRYRLLHGGGKYVWLSIFGRVTTDAAGEKYLNIYYSDATEQVEAEEQQKELLDNMPCGAALYEFDGDKVSLVHLNKRYFELMGREGDAHTKSNFLDAVYSEDRDVISLELKAGIRENRDVECDLRILYGESEYRPFHVTGRVLRREDGKYSIYAAYTPISEEKMSVQTMLAISLSAMLESQTGYAFVKDKNLRYVCSSRQVAQLVNASSPAAMVGKNDYDFFDKSLADVFRKDDMHILETGQSLIDHIDRLSSETGTDHYACTSKYPLRDSQGNVVGVYGIGRDVTETRKMESRLALLTNNIPGGIAIYEGVPEALDKIKLTYFSDGFCCLFGYTREEYEKLAEKNPLGLVFPADLSTMYEKVIALVKDGVPMDFIYRVTAKGGEHKWINVKAAMGEPNGRNLSVNALLFDVTEHQTALEQLRISEEENRLAMKHTRNAVCRYDVAMKTLAVPEQIQKEFHLPATIENVPEAPIKDGAISQDTADAYRTFYEEIARGVEAGAAVFQRRSPQGWRWLEAHFSTIFSDSGEAVSAVASFVDVTEQREKDSAYIHWQQSFLSRNASTYSMFRCNINRKTTFDTRSGALLDIEFGQEPFLFDDHTAEYVEKYVVDEDKERFSAFLNVDALLSGFYQGKRITELEYREKKPKGNYRWLKLTVDLVEHEKNADVEAYLLFEDIDRTKRLELATLEMAETDPLTGVLNRTAFVSQVNNIIYTSKPNTQHALMMLDIDGFKQVNDAFGHGAGDQTLVDIAASLRTVLRHGDLVGRLGGDEFLVFLTDIPGDIIASNKARQICAITRKAFSAEVMISGSIGIAITPRDGTDFDMLYKKADAALYHVKGSGKDNFAFFQDDMADEQLTEDSKPQGGEPITTAKKKRRMLIVDDSRIDQAILANIFADDFIIEKAQDGNAALIRLRHYGSALSAVLLDLIMPGMDGFAVLKKMQESAELRSIPVVVVSSGDNQETGLRAIREGAADFVNKPVDPQLLRIRVRAAITKAENERLRANNSFHEYQSGEIARYKIALEHSGIVLVENDWIAGTFSYDPLISQHIAGSFDSRGFWQILLSDFVAETQTVQHMQQLTHEVATDRARRNEQLMVRLKAPDNSYHSFKMIVYKLVNEFGIAGKLYMAFLDMGSISEE